MLCPRIHCIFQFLNWYYLIRNDIESEILHIKKSVFKCVRLILHGNQIKSGEPDLTIQNISIYMIDS